MITSRHVVISPDNRQPYGAVQVSFKSRHQEVPAEIKSCDPDKDIDLCLLKISETDAKGFGIFPPQTSCRDIKVGESLTSVGWPADQKSDQDTVPGTTTGNLGSFGAYPTTLPLISGMSGGPVYDEEGVVIAVNLGALKDNPTRTFILPYAYTRSVLFKSTVPACEQGAGKVNYTLHVRVSKFANLPIKRLQDAGETSKGYSIEYSADDGYRIAESTFLCSHCNGCVFSKPLVLDDGSGGSFSYTLYKSSGYIEGSIRLKETKDLKQSLDLPSPVKDGWTWSNPLPPDVLSIESIELLDSAGKSIGETTLPGNIMLSDQRTNLNWSQLNRSLWLSVGPH